MKIGLPKIGFSKKLALISLGMLGLLGGTGAAALYVGKEKLIGKPESNNLGGACNTVQTVVLKTPARRLWMRKYVSMDSLTGEERIKTALRVAGLLAKSNDVDLVQVNVLDTNGPKTRAEMRGRAIGAEVVIAMQPQYLPDMTEPFIARYYDGAPAPDGTFYGKRVSLGLDEVRHMMAAMKDDPDKEGCTELPRPEGEANGEGGKEGGVVSEHGGSAKTEHGATEGEGDKKPEAHGEAGKEGAGQHEAAAEKQTSMMDSILGLVGLGGGGATKAEQPAEHGGEQQSPGENHANSTQEKSQSAAEHASSGGYLDMVMNLVGLGSTKQEADKPVESKAASGASTEH